MDGDCGVTRLFSSNMQRQQKRNKKEKDVADALGRTRVLALAVF